MKEGSFLFNDALNTVYLNTVEETRCHHMGYSFRLAARVFYMHHPTDRNTGWNEK